MAKENRSSPLPVNLSKQDIYDFSAKFAEWCHYRPGGDLRSIVEDELGGELVYQNLEEWENTDSGSIIVRGYRDFTIFISNFTGHLRDRFTIVHELGHYVLHTQLGKHTFSFERYNPNNGTNRLEWEANWFAAGFLMPESEFYSAHNVSPDIYYLANHFLVSPQAIEFRKNYLGLH